MRTMIPTGSEAQCGLPAVPHIFIEKEADTAVQVLNITSDAAFGATVTGTGRHYVRNLEDATRIAVHHEVTAVGATPTMTFTIQGCPAGLDPTVSANWIDIAYVTGDATVAVAKTAITVTTVSNTVRYIDGLDKRFFHAIGINVTANTNVTYRTKLLRADRD